jgi:hypothetical protein
MLLVGGLVVPFLAVPEQGRVEATPDAGGINALRVIATATLPRDAVEDAIAPLPEDERIVDATLAGGLSGIDYDPETGGWIAISDDPSENAPARYYTLDLAYDHDSIDTFEILSAVTLLQENGEPYPDAQSGGNVPDLESIRFDPQSDDVWYASEGSDDSGIDPFIAASDPDGKLITSLVIPMFMVPGDENRGPRENLAFEGLTFSVDGASLWVANEGPLYQDGEPSSHESTSYSRITQIDREGNVIGQFACQIDRLPEQPETSATIGFSEILAVSERSFLVIERASVETPTTINYYVRIHEVSVDGATDISGIDALESTAFVPASRRLVLDLNAAGVEPMTNVEGIAWGPDLENGNRSLVLVSDDNFHEDQVTQVIVLEVDM